MSAPDKPRLTVTSIMRRLGRGEAKACDEEGRWACRVCSYAYSPSIGDPDHGVPPGTRFEDIPDDWVCPRCGAGKDMFVPENAPPSQW